MSSKAYWILVPVVAVLASLYDPSHWLEITLAVVALALIPWYFGTRRRDREPTATERRLATAWTWLRRVTCFVAGGICLAGVGYILFTVEVSGYRPIQWFALALLLLLGVALLAYGVVGGRGKRPMQDS